MSICAAFADHRWGIWGASRHALTVGFAATMVFPIGPHILPHFGGVHSIFSKRLMFLSLLLLQTGCLLRVYSEPLEVFYGCCRVQRGPGVHATADHEVGTTLYLLEKCSTYERLLPLHGR
jgi:hypothetical protein